MTYPILITNLQKLSQGSGFQMSVRLYTSTTEERECLCVRL